MSLLHHVNNIEASVREMKRVAGRAVLACEPNLYSPLQWLSALRPHERQAFAHQIIQSDGIIKYYPGFPRAILDLEAR